MCTVVYVCCDGVQIRRKIPTPGGAHTLSYGSVAEGGLTGVRQKQLQMANTVRALYSKCSQRASSLTGKRGRRGNMSTCLLLTSASFMSVYSFFHPNTSNCTHIMYMCISVVKECVT